MAKAEQVKKQIAPVGKPGAINGGDAGKNHIQEDYSTNIPGLAQIHYEMLKASAIGDEVIRERGYRTVTDAAELRTLGFSVAQERAPGLLLPLHTTDGQTPVHIYRPDNPRVIEDKRHRERDGAYRQKVIKYEMPMGERSAIGCASQVQAASRRSCGASLDHRGTEESRHAGQRGLCSIALLGVWGFIGTNEKGGKVFLNDFSDIALNDERQVRIVFDSDVMKKPEVRRALEVLISRMQRKGAIVEAVYLPDGTGSKIGVDDWLADGHTVDELEELVEAPRPEMKIAPPTVELLDEAPLAIRRPLCLVKGRAYAAVWPYTLTRISQKLVNGQVVQLREPEQIKERSLHVVSSEGKIYGPFENPMSTLDIDVLLTEPPPATDSLWSTPGIKAYLQGLSSGSGLCFPTRESCDRPVH